MVIPSQFAPWALSQEVQSLPPEVAKIFLLLAMAVITLAILLGLLIVAVRFLRRDPGRKLGSEPTCGGCGYVVTGLTTFVCPECGSDLRQVGINRPATPRALKSAPAPSPSAPTNRTATILLTDMKDYTSRAEGSSRDAMLALLRRHRDIVQPIVQRRAGRVIKSTGDGLIASFDSATDALLAAIDVQDAVARNNAESFSDENKFHLRIAVSTGEVSFMDNDVLGQPVNLASRVQQLAPPGDVYFTDATFHAMNRTEIKFEPLGPVEIKGLAEKINLYRCVRPPPVPPPAV